MGMLPQEPAHDDLGLASGQPPGRKGTLSLLTYAAGVRNDGMGGKEGAVLRSGASASRGLALNVVIDDTVRVRGYGVPLSVVIVDEPEHRDP